jgi:hypothetical protein
VTEPHASGIELARAFYDEAVRPLLAERFHGLPHAAGRLGSGSDVLGLDDLTSQDHDWGLRLSLFVPAAAVEPVDEMLTLALPDTVRGLLTRFAFTGETGARHHVEVNDVATFLHDRVGFDPRRPMTPRAWLSLSGQAVLEVTAGPLFVDGTGELAAAREALGWYPPDLWRYVLACDWIRLGQELPLMGRSADAGDELGSRVITTRLVHITMHLAFLLERKWPPYAKWFGTLFARLDVAAELAPLLDVAVRAETAADRQAALADAFEVLARRQSALGLTSTMPATVPFWDRPYRHPNPAIIDQLIDGIEDATIRALPRGLGSIEQRTDNADVLTDAEARRRSVS